MAELNVPKSGPWFGVPFSQNTTFGQPLSQYANVVDQVYASQQPMPTGRQFPRWNFGWPQGGPALPQSPGLLGQQAGQQAPPGGLLGGAPQVNIQGGQPQAATQQPPAAQSGSKTLFGRNLGQQAPQQQAAGNAGWRNFQFQNPTTPFAQNFNSLAQVNPDLAYSYAFNSGGTLDSRTRNELNQALQSAGYNPNAIINAYVGAGVSPTSETGRGLGLAADWVRPDNAYIDPRTGQSVTWNGRQYALPQAIPTGMTQGWGGTWTAPAQPQNTAGQVGSPEWWAAVRAAQGG